MGTAIPTAILGCERQIEEPGKLLFDLELVAVTAMPSRTTVLGTRGRPRAGIAVIGPLPVTGNPRDLAVLQSTAPYDGKAGGAGRSAPAC